MALKFQFFCTRWGQENVPWPEFCKKVKDAGFDGVETTLPADSKALDIILTQLDKTGLKLIGVQWDTGTPDFDEHYQEYAVRLRHAAAGKPVFITSHTGKDHFSFEQNAALIQLASEISAETGTKIIHETHRGKFSFAAHITKNYVEQIPGLRLTLDVSHWFTVAESYLTDQQEALEAAIQRTDHIHARIGYLNGPQVTDPRSSEWSDVVEKHLDIWRRVIALKQKNGIGELTFTTEFGPFPYMQLQPFTGKPLADQWEINEHMLSLLKSTFTKTI